MMPASAPCPSSARCLRILCADDHEQMALLAQLVLQRAGYSVEHVTDGQQAWERIMKDPTFFDVVITDHQMPHLTGLQLVGKLRAASYPGRIVVHSSFLSPEEKEAFVALRVDAILEKPASVRQLVKHVNSFT